MNIFKIIKITSKKVLILKKCKIGKFFNNQIGSKLTILSLKMIDIYNSKLKKQIKNFILNYQEKRFKILVINMTIKNLSKIRMMCYNNISALYVQI